MQSRGTDRRAFQPRLSDLVPEEFDGYTVAVELVGKIEPYRKSDFMCGGPGD
jgi:hypothetical protein